MTPTSPEHSEASAPTGSLKAAIAAESPRTGSWDAIPDGAASSVVTVSARGERITPRTLALTALMAALVAISAWISIPFYPVPLTLQTLAVLLAAGLLGRVWGPVAILVYLGLGVAGMPVFHNGLSGPGVILGPTGGYLLAFVPAAFVMGLAGDAARRMGIDKRRSLAVLVAGVAIASLVVYLIGVPWLAAVLHYSPGKAVAVGMVPFLAGDALKATVAVLLLRAISRALGRQDRP